MPTVNVSLDEEDADKGIMKVGANYDAIRDALDVVLNLPAYEFTVFLAHLKFYTRDLTPTDARP